MRLERAQLAYVVKWGGAVSVRRIESQCRSVLRTDGEHSKESLHIASMAWHRL